MQPLLREAGSLLRLALPIMGGMIAWTLLGLIDGLMIGRLGTTALAAASLVTTAVLILQAGIYGFLLPSAILTGEAHGGGDTVRAVSVLRHGLVVGLLTGVGGAVVFALLWLGVPHLGQPPDVVALAMAFWLVSGLTMIPNSTMNVAKQFFESVDRPWTGLVLLLPGLALKVPLNEVLMFEAGLGLVGAAIANGIVMIVWTSSLLLYLRFSPTMARYRVSTGPVTSAGVVEQMRSGTFMGLQYVLEGGSVTIAGVAIGWLGAVALAANQIAFTVGSTLYMVPLGMAAAVAVRLAQAVGADQRTRLRAICDAANGVVVVWMIGAGVLFVVAGPTMARAFTDDPAVVATASTMFLVFAAMQVFDGVQSVSLGALRGLHDTRWPTLVSLVAYWLLSLPLGFVLAFPLGWGAPGVWAGFGLGLGIAAVALYTRLRRRTAGLA